MGWWSREEGRHTQSHKARGHGGQYEVHIIFGRAGTDDAWGEVAEACWRDRNFPVAVWERG